MIFIRLLGVAVALTVASATLARPVDSSKTDVAACEAVQALVEQDLSQRTDRPEAILAFSGDAADQDDSVQDFRRNWRGPPPSAALSYQFLHQGLRDPITACPLLRRRLDEAHIIHDQSQVDAIIDKPRANFSVYPISIFAIALPVVTDNGQEALVHTARGGGPLAGGEQVLHMRKGQDGKWRVIDGKITAIA